MTTTSSVPAGAMPGWIKASLSATLVFAAGWVSAIWYWRGNDSTPAASQVLLLLLVLPLGLIGAFWVGNRLFGRPAPTVAAVAAAPTPAESIRPTPAIAVLASALRMPFGASGEAASAALADNKAHTDLDPELVDDHGHPVMSARAAGAVDAVLRDELTDWLAAHAPADLHFSEAAWRTLTLGTAVMRDLVGQATLRLHADAPTTLHLLPVLPPEWSPAQRQAAASWWQHSAIQAGWPAAHTVVVAQHPNDPSPAALLDGLARASTQSGMTILLACASYLCQDTVDHWSAQGTLFTPATPKGRVPGEGAAGLLLARGGDGALHLHLELDAGDAAASSAKRLSPERLGALADRVLQGTRTARADIAHIVADTGADPRHVLELMAFVDTAAPHLDAATDLVQVGPACGASAAVPLVAALAVAGQMALEREAPLLCVSTDTPALRAVALIRRAEAV